MRVLLSTILAISLLMPAMSFARESIVEFSIEDALNKPAAVEKLGDQVSFYFGEQKLAEKGSVLATIKTSKKTNAFNKTDVQACEWALYSALIAFKKRALAEGGNAVVEIQSNYQNVQTSSEETFKCGAGNVIAGVAITGKVVRLEDAK